MMTGMPDPGSPDPGSTDARSPDLGSPDPGNPVESRPFQAAVFDLDGTLVDSETRSHESWRHVFRSRGIVPDDSLIRAFVGRRGIDVHDLLKEQVPGHDPAELMAATSEHFHAPHQPPLGPLAGAVELVRLIAAAGVPLALVTSAGRPYAEQTLDELGVHELFSVVVTAEDVTVGKPDPEGYLAAAGGWARRPRRAWCSRTPRPESPPRRRPGCTASRWPPPTRRRTWPGRTRWSPT